MRSWMNGCMRDKFKVVLDTNILLVSVSDRSQYHWLFQALQQNEFQIAITNEILLEYEEIISEKISVGLAKEVTGTLLFLPNVDHIDTFYQWYLIVDDVDDNKFVDCAIAANVDYIVTEDKHFNILQEVEFPTVNVVNLSEFQMLLTTGKI